MKRKIRYAVAVATAMGLCGCAQQTQAIRPSATQLQALEPLSVVDVIAQNNLAAQDTFSGTYINVIAGPGVPIMAAAAGGAIATIIIDATAKAAAKRFAEDHVQPLREVLQDFDARSALSDSLQQALAKQSGNFKGFTASTAVSTSAAHGLLVQTIYSMTPDFSALQVIAKVSIHGAGGGQDKPVYQNVLVYQSPRQVVAAKSAADSKRLVAEENQRYAKLDVDHDIDKANADPERRDSEMAQLREKINHEQVEHRNRLARAAAPNWDADSRARRMAEAWAANGGEALKVALRASGPEIAHMLQLDLADQVASGHAKSKRTVFSSDTREIEYVSGGRMISLAPADSDASVNKSSPMVTVPMNAPTRR